MRGQRASAPVRLARWAAALVMVGLAAVIAVKLADRTGRPAAPAAAPPPSDGPAARQTNIRHEEYKDGRLVAVVRGDTFSVGADGRSRLAGRVDVVNYGPEGRETAHLTADEVAYDRDTLVFEFSDRVRIEAGGVVLEGEAFSFDRSKGLFGTTSGGRFSSKTLSGSAPEISYDEAADEVRLGGGFAAEIEAAKGGMDRLTLAGRSLRYVRRAREGRMEGRASIAGRDFRAAAGAVSFIGAADEAGLEQAVLESGAEVVLGGRTPSSGHGTIVSDRIEVGFFPEGEAMSVKVEDRGRLDLRSGADQAMSVTASSILLNYFRTDGHWTWEAKGGIRADLAEAGGARRTVEGEEAVFDGVRSLHVSAAPGGRAVAESAEARIEAPRLSVGPASGSLYARGGVTGVLRAGDGGRRTAFFAPGEDVAVSCQMLETRPEAEATLLTGSVSVRQRDASIKGGEIQLAGEAGRMSGGGGVAVTMTEPGSDGRPGRTIELAGEDMAYRPDTRTLTVTAKASLRLPEARLEAGTVSAVLARDGLTVETLEARTAVVVSKGRFAGRSEAASYDAAAGRITLTGKPVLTDDKGGAARGVKLTFDLADDKILIENEGPGRAATIVRS